MALYELKYIKGKPCYTFVPISTPLPTTTSTTKESEKFICDQCGLKFVSEVRLQWHRSTHNPLKNCKSSKKQTRKEKSATIASLRSSSSSKKLKFICPTCEFCTSERQMMIDHFSAKHCIKASELKNVNDEEQAPVVDEEVEEVEMTELTCSQCGFSSYDQDDLDFHTCIKPDQEATSFSCHLCTYECLTRMGLQSHITRKHKPKPGCEVPARYSCDECDYKCANKNTMYSHKRKHRSKPAAKRKAPTQEKKIKNENDDLQCTYFCNECDYSTIKKSVLYQHIQRRHGKGIQDERFHLVPGPVDIYACDQCSYTNKNRYEMKVHVIRKHSNEYNYECETCGKKYKIKGDLTNHIRFQHREQPIICDVCGKTCGNSNSLYVHQKFAHYKAEFECPICHRRMVSQANLDEHVLKQHEQREDAVCEECGKTFTRQSRLKIHMRIHLGIKPHTCKLCGKAFSRKTALRQHLLIHSGQRPYLCDICGKSFTQKPGLISHRKSHPGTHPPLPRVTIDHVLSDLLTAQEI